MSIAFDFLVCGKQNLWNHLQKRSAIRDSAKYRPVAEKGGGVGGMGGWSRKVEETTLYKDICFKHFFENKSLTCLNNLSWSKCLPPWKRSPPPFYTLSLCRHGLIQPLPCSKNTTEYMKQMSLTEPIRHYSYIKGRKAIVHCHSIFLL